MLLISAIEQHLVSALWYLWQGLSRLPQFFLGGAASAGASLIVVLRVFLSLWKRPSAWAPLMVVLRIALRLRKRPSGSLGRISDHFSLPSLHPLRSGGSSRPSLHPFRPAALHHGRHPTATMKIPLFLKIPQGKSQSMAVWLLFQDIFVVFLRNPLDKPPFFT